MATPTDQLAAPILSDRPSKNENDKNNDKIQRTGSYEIGKLLFNPYLHIYHQFLYKICKCKLKCK